MSLFMSNLYYLNQKKSFLLFEKSASIADEYIITISRLSLNTILYRIIMKIKSPYSYIQKNLNCDLQMILFSY